MLADTAPRKVLVATPALDGRLDVWYTNSLVDTVRLTQASGILLHAVFMSYDALIQRVRNDLLGIAVEGGYDDLIFIDSDMEWEPKWIMELLAREEDVVGGTARKKTDEAEIYVGKTSDLSYHENGLIKCEGLGTGFVKLSRKAFTAVWDASVEYQNEGRVRRMVFDVQVVDGQLFSEDTVLFRKLNALGFDCWLDPRMTCAHIGTKKFIGNLAEHLSALQAAAVEAVATESSEES
jgi:hypothetical protein